MEETNNKKIEFDVIKFFKLLSENRKKLCLYTFIGAVVGVIIAFSIPKEYKAEVSLAPESSEGSSLTSNISSLASMVGMDMNFGGGADAIFPEIYPDLMQSTDFIVGLFSVRVKSLEGDIDTDYYDYLKTKQKAPWWNYPMVLLKQVIKSLKPADHRSASQGQEGPDPFCLTRDEFEIAKAISSLIDCQVDKRTSVISITTKAQDPLIAATLADSVKARLQLYITNYRTSKARNDLDYINKIYEEARSDYKEAEMRYARYADTHRNTVLTAYSTEQEDLENEMQLRYNIFSQVAQQVQIAKSKVQERTPAFTVVRSATVPIKHSNMTKITVMLIWAFLACVFSVCLLVWKHKKSLFTINM